MSRPKLAHVTTVDVSLDGLLRNQMLSLLDAGYDVCGISAPGRLVPLLEAAGIRHLAVPMSRNFSPLADLRSLWRLWRIMRHERFDIIHTHTPKAGLLGQLAARLAGVPVIVNTVHGFYFHDHMPERSRRFYIFMESIAALCSHAILSQNAEDLETAVRENVCRREKIQILGNGIDLTLFNPARFSANDKSRIRHDLGIAAEAPVVGFVGRLAGKRKGFLDFLAAGKAIAAQCSDVRFLIVGATDPGKPDAVEPSMAGDYGIAERCVFLGHLDNGALPALYHAMDVLVLPSLFEGVPRVVMEASAMGKPCVVTDVKGNREAVVHDRSGLLVPLADVPALTAAILGILNEPDTARRMGYEARAIATETFDELAVFEKVKSTYERLLTRAGLSRPVKPKKDVALQG